jgi:hypothetical protein
VAARSADFAAATAEALRAAPARAQAWLDLAAKLAPGSAAGWRARMLMGSDQGRADAALDAGGRLLAWAPDWDAGQDALLRCLDRLPAESLDDPRPSILVRTLLRSDRAWPAEAWDSFARVLGTQDLARLVAGLDSKRARVAALPWLRDHADLDAWQAVRRNLPPDRPLDPIQWRIADDDHDPRRFALAIAADRNGRHDQAERCLRAGVGLPPPLAEALAGDGETGAIQVQLAAALTGETPANLRPALDRLLHQPWARAWWKLLHEREEAALGHWSALDAQSEPPLLAQAAAAAARAGDAAAAARLATLLSPLRETAQWTDAGRGVRWSWMLCGEDSPQAAVCRGWTAIYCDGRWLGWKRGLVDLGALDGAGVHRIVLADPP